MMHIQPPHTRGLGAKLKFFGHRLSLQISDLIHNVFTIIIVIRGHVLIARRQATLNEGIFVQMKIAIQYFAEAKRQTRKDKLFLDKVPEKETKSFKVYHTVLATFSPSIAS